MTDSIDRFFAEWAEQNAGLPNLPADIQYIYRIARISKLLGARLDATCARHGLTRSQFEALAALRRNHPRPLSAQDLMQASLLTSGSVTAMINRLLAAKLVVRDQSDEDARRILVRLTDAGMKVIEAAVRERIADNTTLAHLLDKKDRGPMNALMRSFLGKLEALEGDAT